MIGVFCFLVGCCNYVYGLQLEIDARLSTGPGSPITVSCYEDDIDRQVIGDIRSLALESVTLGGLPAPATRPAVIRKRQTRVGYTYKQVVQIVKTGDIVWGEEYDFESRSSLTGTIRTGLSSLRMSVRYTTCNDNMTFVCVAVGNNGSVDSNKKPFKAYNPGTAVSAQPVVRGGRRCPYLDSQYDDRCDVYASVDDDIDFRCLADVQYPLNWNSVTWYLGNKETIYQGDSFKTVFQNTSTGICSGRLVSSLQYRHLPKQSSEDVQVTCIIEFSPPETELISMRIGTITVCYEGSNRKIYNLTEIQMAGLGCAGFLALALIIVIVYTCILCCGRRLKVEKGNSLPIAKIQSNELKQKY